jgi:putative ABC transport system permease protein
MFGSFFKVAFRILLKNRVRTLMNILGLSIGLTFSIIIFLYAHKEISYDRFHKNAKRIYRVAVDGRIADNKIQHLLTPEPLAPAMTKEIPEVESAVRIIRMGSLLVRYKNARYSEENVIFTDPNFFQVFTFPLIQGVPDEVLRDSNSIVISKKTAFKYFGQDDPVGKKLQIENDSTYYLVTGIMNDVPANSHLHFDMVGALSAFGKDPENDRWVISYLYTYFLAKQNTGLDKITKGLDDIAKNHVLPDYSKLLDLNHEQAVTEHDYYSFVIQPLTSIHLKPGFPDEFEPGGKLLYVCLFIVLAVVVLILSCLNFIGLDIAQSVNRAKEVSIRKIVGSDKHTLIRQFLLESSLLAIFSMIIALFLTEVTLPLFSRYLGINLSLGQLLNTAGVILMILLIMAIGLISGLYPALHLSSFTPLTLTRSHIQIHAGKNRIRKGLVLFQLFIALGTITMTLIMFSQYRYLIRKERGYEVKDLIVISRPDGLKNKLDDYEKLIRKYPGVVSVTSSSSLPGGGFSRNPYYPEGTSIARNYSASNFLVSCGFDSTYRIKMAEGRFFARGLPQDTAACIINETAAKLMGIPDPVGKTLIKITGTPEREIRYQIIGVVRDFHFETLDKPIGSMVMVLMPDYLEGYLSVKLAADHQDETRKYLQTTWENFTKDYPYVGYSFENEVKNYYSTIRQIGRVFILLSIIALLIAGLGLFTMVSVNYNNMQHVIGIQKTVGADNRLIILQKVNEMVKMIMISSVMAWVGSFFLALEWFKGYAYHIKLSLVYFLIPTMLITVITFLAVYYHGYLVARINPGMALKYE